MLGCVGTLGKMLCIFTFTISMFTTNVSFLFEKLQQLVRDLYRSLQEEDESFAGFDVK